VKAATGEVVSAEDLGGGDVHTRLSGVADHWPTTTRMRWRWRARRVANLNGRGKRALPDGLLRPRRSALRSGEIAGCRARRHPPPYDVREVIARIVDGSRFDEFKARYGTTLVCGFAHVHGMPVGILANNGVLFSESAVKGAHFVELCSQRKIPLVFLQNITGFMVGSKYEAGGIAKDGAKLVTAVATTKVPKITMIVGGSFGAGNYGMCGRAYSPRFLWTWPNSRISVMGGEQAAGVLATVKRDGIERKGGTWSAKTRPSSSARRSRCSSASRTRSMPRRGSGTTASSIRARPATILALSLSAALNAPVEDTKFGVFRMYIPFRGASHSLGHAG
jgi:3-methylcrotonyl-CoA carboxylase beta subunit